MTKAIDQAGGERSRTSVERGRVSRAKLLAAATELIPRVGWNAVTTRSLAAHAGVRPGLVHYHFDSSADLLRTAATEVFTEALEVPLEAMIATEDPTEGALAALHIMNGHGGKGRPASVLLAEACLAAIRDPVLHETVSQLLERTRTSIADWLARLGTPQPEAVAEILCAFFDGPVLHRALMPVPGPESCLEPLHRLTSDSFPEGKT